MNVKEYLAEARELHKKGKLYEREKLLEEALEKFPREIKIINNLIMVYGSKQSGKAIDLYKFAVHSEIHNLATCNAILGVCASIKDKETCEDLFRYIKKNYNERNINATYFNMLLLYKFTKDVSSRVEIFNEAKERNIIDKYLYSNMLEIYIDSKQFEQAKKLFNEILNKKMANPLIVSSFLKTFYKTKNYEEGLNFITSLPPNLKDSLVYVAEIEFKKNLKKYDECLFLISKILSYEKLNPEQEIRVKLIQGDCYKFKNNRFRAICIYREILKDFNESNKHYYKAILGLVSLKDVKKEEVNNFTRVLVNRQTGFKNKNYLINIAINKLTTLEEKFKLKHNKKESKPKKRFNHKR